MYYSLRASSCPNASQLHKPSAIATHASFIHQRATLATYRRKSNISNSFHYILNLAFMKGFVLLL